MRPRSFNNVVLRRIRRDSSRGWLLGHSLGRSPSERSASFQSATESGPVVELMLEYSLGSVLVTKFNESFRTECI